MCTKCEGFLFGFSDHMYYVLQTSNVLFFFNGSPFRIIGVSCAGRRGVFDGVVENMHLHWKHRELVKVIFKGPIFEAEQTAKILEMESGGVLVGIVTTTKGQAIIFYRGKNYQRPSELRPRHLLSKRQAYERSLEMQRKRVISKPFSSF